MRTIRLGTSIYIIYEYAIYKVHVYMKGKEEFCHDEAFDADYLESYRWPLRYDEEGITWFRTIKDAKAKLREKYPKDEYKIVKLDECWEAQYK